MRCIAPRALSEGSGAPARIHQRRREIPGFQGVCPSAKADRWYTTRAECWANPTSLRRLGIHSNVPLIPFQQQASSSISSGSGRNDEMSIVRGSVRCVSVSGNLFGLIMQSMLSFFKCKWVSNGGNSTLNLSSLSSSSSSPSLSSYSLKSIK